MVARQSVVLPAPPVAWPPDDTEESVLSTDLHQSAITNLRLAINELAALHSPPGGPVPWQAGGQIIFSGFQRPDGSRFQPLPDIFVCRRPFDRRRKSLAIAVNGPPLLVIEVLSDTTYESDLDLEHGKGFSYAQVGVREYLTLDWSAEYLPEQGRGWRLEGDAYQVWLPEVTGRWQSREVPLAIGMEGPMVAVYTLDGRRLPREGAIERERSMLQHLWDEERRQRQAELERLDRRHAEELARQQAELADRNRQQAEELAAKEAELAALRRRLEELERGE